MTDHAAFAMGWTSGLFMGMGLMKLAWERERRYQRRRAGPGHEPLPPAPMTVEELARRRFNHENRRGPVGPPPLNLRRSGDPGAIRPTTPKPDIVPKPQPPPGRVVDVYGCTIGYIPRSQGGTPNPPPTDP